MKSGWLNVEENGEYEIKAVPPGRKYILSAKADGFGIDEKSANQEIVAPEDDENENIQALAVLCDTPGLTAINLGQPEMWDHEHVVSQCHENGMIYYGYWLRRPDESMEDYLRRGVALCGPERNRAILFMKANPPWKTNWPEPIR